MAAHRLILQRLFHFLVVYWIHTTNVFNLIVADEILLARRQFRTSLDNMRWDSRFEGNAPISCFPFSWIGGDVVASIIALFFIVLEIQFYQTLNGNKPSAVRITFIGILCDLLLIVAAAKVLLFDKKH